MKHYISKEKLEALKSMYKDRDLIHELIGCLLSCLESEEKCACNKETRIWCEKHLEEMTQSESIPKSSKLEEVSMTREELKEIIYQYQELDIRRIGQLDKYRKTLEEIVNFDPILFRTKSEILLYWEKLANKALEDE